MFNSQEILSMVGPIGSSFYLCTLGMSNELSGMYHISSIDNPLCIMSYPLYEGAALKYNSDLLFRTLSS